MEQGKNRGLVILVVILTCLLLISVGYIVYDRINNSEDNNASDKIDMTIKENLYDNVSEVEKETLDELYYLIGAIPETDEELTATRHCLNVAVTNTTYLGNLSNARDIFSWYAVTYHKYADHEKYKDAIYKTDDGMELSAYQCAACNTIEKTEAEKFKKLYSFGPLERDNNLTFNEVVNYDNIYQVVSSLGSPMHCDYNVKHNIIDVYVSKGTEAETIYITDEQIVTRYDDVDTNSISQQTKQTVNYAFFKNNSSDKYLLDQVFHRKKVK